MESHKFLQQSGRRNLPPEEVRNLFVNVRLNAAELALLDDIRGAHSRAEALRFSALSNLPAPIPVINAELRYELKKSYGNLASAACAMREGQYKEIVALTNKLHAQLAEAVK